MEQTTVTHQPGLSVTKASALAFQEEEVGCSTTGSEDNWRSNDVPAATDPVLTQPGLGVTTTTITTITQTGGGWSTGLLDVCGDKTTCNMKRRHSRGPGAVLLRPEFSSPVRRVSVHASATRIHFCHTSWDQGAVQDTGQCV
ncbi:uncharacterized protein plac8l1 isoform X2 [Siniperca chuatsi]|uniref:uncharacterized protein plac8l1 isoform X2 n=1 Tax=Siniperca chuatsi TaxID=119488 RepID=UPI001CE18B0E|nr:uncharacterized protein plac8l1 isoform X2 [Siniperca chuatsi]